LLAAEDISRTVSNSRSRAIRKLADKIKQAFNDIRSLFKKYSDNIEFVDPQLKNNNDLSEALLTLEKSWEKGKEYLVNENVRRLLISITLMIEGLTEKHVEIQDKIESMDTDLFMIVPSILILRSLDENDLRIFQSYCPELLQQQNSEQNILDKLKSDYERMRRKNDGFVLYNIVENAILEKEIDSKQQMGFNFNKQDIDKIVHEIKQIAILLQRSKPTEWNMLMETAMGII